MDYKLKLLKLCNLLAQKDETKNCPFCHKVEWGEEFHDKGCPFAFAYETIERIKIIELKQQKLRQKNDSTSHATGKAGQ